MYTQTFAQTMTCAHERTLGTFRIRLRKHLRKHARNGNGDVRLLGEKRHPRGCGSRSRMRRNGWGRSRCGKPNTYHHKEGNTKKIQTSPKTAYTAQLLSHAAPHKSHAMRTCGDPFNTLANGADLTFFFFKLSSYIISVY